MTNTKPTAITELLLADAQLAVLGGCLPTTALTALAAELDTVGYAALQVMTPTLYRLCLDTLGESPWQRMESLKQAAPKTRLLATLSVTQLFGTELVDSTVREACIDQLSEAGIGILRWTDVTVDPELTKEAVAFTQEQGMKAQLSLRWNARMNNAVADVCKQAAAVEEVTADALVISDTSGNLSPARLTRLVEQLKATSHLPLQLHMSEATGIASASALAALEAGLAGVDMALSAFSMGYSFPPTETLVATLAESKLDTGLSLTKLEAIAGNARALRLKYAAKDTASPGLDVRLLKHHLPAYTLRDLEESLENEQASELFEDALAHINTVRLAAGEPVMTESVSQVLVKQTVLNVLCDSPFQSLTSDYQQLLKNNLRLSEKNISDLTERVAESLIDENKTVKSLEDYATALTQWSSADIATKAGDSKSTLMDYVFYPKETLKLLQQQDVSDAVAAKLESAGVEASDAEVYTVSVDGKAYVVSVDSNGQVNGIVPPAQN
ncbi:hypothetical protein [Leucothrix mucor]|uniref:hypothetical protein n=1 Tax=Leucothrix mucor TaxID=45248 RepID=UPI0003B756CE|nr:hypothetical protein [Leucothrix mucor]